MQGEDLRQLTEDIKVHGLREPIYLYQEKIIDGRNRYRACQEAGIAPHLREWDGRGSLVAFVVSLNFYRRHLDETGRAIVGAKAKPLFEEETRERQRTRTDLQANWPEGSYVCPYCHCRHDEKPHICPQAGHARDHAAKLVNVSPRLIESAAKVLKEGTEELKRAMETGKIPASRVEQLVSASPEFPKAVVQKLERGEAAKPMEAIRQVKAEPIKENQAVMPSGKFRVLYADPPWSYGNTQPDYHTEQRDHYPVMSPQPSAPCPFKSSVKPTPCAFWG